MAEDADAPGGGAGAVFDALGDPTRRAVLEAVAGTGPTSATQLASLFPVTRQAVLKHLGALSSAGLVTSERTGREVLYRLTPDPLDRAAGWLTDVEGAWDARLERLRSHLDGGGKRR